MVVILLKPTVLTAEVIILKSLLLQQTGKFFLFLSASEQMSLQLPGPPVERPCLVLFQLNITLEFVDGNVEGIDYPLAFQ